MDSSDLIYIWLLLFLKFLILFVVFICFYLIYMSLFVLFCSQLVFQLQGQNLTILWSSNVVFLTHYWLFLSNSSNYFRQR